MFKINKTKIFVVVAILIAGVLLVALGNVTGGFQNLHPDDWVFREVNPDNLYHSLTFADTDGVIANGADGITVTAVVDQKIHGMLKRFDPAWQEPQED